MGKTYQPTHYCKIPTGIRVSFRLCLEVTKNKCHVICLLTHVAWWNKAVNAHDLFCIIRRKERGLITFLSQTWRVLKSGSIRHLNLNIAMLMLKSLEVVTVSLQHMIKTSLSLHHHPAAQNQIVKVMRKSRQRPWRLTIFLRDATNLMLPTYYLHQMLSAKFLSYHKIIKHLSTYSVGPR